MIDVIDNNIHINGSIINVQYVYNIGEVLCVIPFTDFVLIKCFGSKPFRAILPPKVSKLKAFYEKHK